MNDPVTRSASAPGRVNLLGGQIDHQGGTVLPVAVNLRTTVEYRPGGAWRITSHDHPEHGAWTRYVRAVIETLEEAGHAARPGALRIRSTIPEGRGLGSSAALEVAVAGALSDLAPLELARLCRKAENAKVGVSCGLMDQITSACAIAGHLMAVDCANDGLYFHLPLPEAEIWLFQSGIRRHLAETPYGERLSETSRPGSDAARHVECEMARVARGVALLDANDAAGFGRLMLQSHASLRDTYRCSLPAIDALVARLAATPGVFGARLTGGGWGGGVVALARRGLDLEGGLRVVSDDGLVRVA